MSFEKPGNLGGLLEGVVPTKPEPPSQVLDHTGRGALLRPDVSRAPRPLRDSRDDHPPLSELMQAFIHDRRRDLELL
jgi:hypothetical protein